MSKTDEEKYNLELEANNRLEEMIEHNRQKTIEAIDLLQSAKRDLIIENNQEAALITLDLATDILANIKEDSITEIVGK